MIVIGCSNSPKLASLVARRMRCRFAALEASRFPDGELLVRFPVGVKGRQVVLVQSFQPQPQEALVEVLLAASTARELGAKRVTLVAPYLGYMRQDARFQPGQAVSALLVAGLVGKLIARVLTIDPHAHRIPKLQAIFGCRLTRLTANNALADFIRSRMRCDVVMGPDAESYQWAEAIAARLGVPAIVLRKKRYSSRHVRVRFAERAELRGKAVVITDDIISTGHTMVEAVKAAKKQGAAQVSCVAVHGVFAENAMQRLRKAGAKCVVTTNTIENRQARIDVAALIAGAL